MKEVKIKSKLELIELSIKYRPRQIYIKANIFPTGNQNNEVFIKIPCDDLEFDNDIKIAFNSLIYALEDKCGIILEQP